MAHAVRSLVRSVARESSAQSVRHVSIFLGDEDADWSVGVCVETIQSTRRSRWGPALFSVTAGAEHESFLKRFSADDRSVPTRRTIRKGDQSRLRSICIYPRRRFEVTANDRIDNRTYLKRGRRVDDNSSRHSNSERRISLNVGWNPLRLCS